MGVIFTMSKPFFIVSGPSGVGKDTVVQRFLEENANVEMCISATTREPRPGEVDGVDYFFMDKKEFVNKIDEDAFLEHQSVHGNFYGTLKSEIERIQESGKIPLMILDTKGAKELKNNGVDVRSIFIEPPSDIELLQRLNGRGTEDLNSLALRFRNAKKEMEDAKDYDFRIVNDSIDSCVDRLSAIFEAEVASDKVIRNVVLTGGPCAGKTSAIAAIDKEFSARGWTVMVVPETATDFISSGIRPWEFDTVDYQTVAMVMQLFREDVTREAAELHPNDKVLIVYDRGCVDQAAYMNENQFAEVRENVGVNKRDLFTRYDSVIHLRTAAYGAEEAYTLSNNAARTETLEEARIKDDSVLELWSEHPNLRVIPNSGNFEDKLQSLINVVAHDLGEPLLTDVQYKFVVKMPDEEWFDNCDSHSESTIITNYLESEYPNESRVRAVGYGDSWVYTKTNKTDTGKGASRLVFERNISEREYLDELQYSSSSNEKKRHNFCIGETFGVIDVYPGNDDLAIMELRAIDESVTSPIPGGIEVIRNVTDNSAFRNRALSGLGNNVSLFDLIYGGNYMENEPQEVEVKLLLDDVDIDAIRSMPGHSEVSIKQTYINVSTPGETRVREKTVDGETSYILTNKQDIDGGFKRIENEREITKEEAKVLLACPDTSREPIKKTRHIIPDGDRNIEMDVYDDASQSVVAEVELSDSRVEDLVFINGSRSRLNVLPDSFPATIVADVTEMKEFKNGSLAKHFPENGLVDMYHELVGDKQKSVVEIEKDVSLVDTFGVSVESDVDEQFQ